MKIKLYSKPCRDIPPKVMVALNRGIEPNKIQKFFNNSLENVFPIDAFNIELLQQGARMLMSYVASEKEAIVIVDSDVDGWTSAALLINYLYECFPAWCENHLHWWLHEGKQHGLNDHIEYLMDYADSLVICPDSATNDIEAIARLHEINTDVLILDHHVSDVPFSEYAITINSQYNYPNKDLSGVGVVYKFCKYLDQLSGKNISDNFLDLVATGLMGDMMDIRSLETKELIFEGFKEKNLKNPLIYGLAKKSEFALSKADYIPSPNNNLALTPMGAAFFIIPLLNALSRSGTLDEKLLVFESMLTMKAYDNIPSNKRGHKPGDIEKRYEQALRTCTNVKNRQTRAEEAGMELLISQAEQMLDNKVLLFVVEPGQIDSNIAGLIANKLVSRYQRPVCVTTHINIPENENDAEREASCGIDCAGSMRGYTATGIDNFKVIAESSSFCNWVRGHENAAGISITDPQSFINDMNETLKDVSTDIVYYVDYIWDADNVDGDAIIDLAELNDYLGTGFARPQVYIQNCEISSFMVMKEKHLKINLPTGCSAIMWDAPEELIERLQVGECITINFVAKCNINEYNWERNPQLIIIDYEEVKIEPNIFKDWGF